MKKILFYSHDSYGLGNIRRTLSICHTLTSRLTDVSILIITGSPMMDRFALPERVEYIKLPCPTRSEQTGALPLSTEETQRAIKQLRSDMILCAMGNYKPDVVLVNRRPSGVKGELEPALAYAKEHLPNTKFVLLLRDILDSPETTCELWEKQHYHRFIRKFYDRILILGQSDIFDPRKEYLFPPSTMKKVRFCGYIRREPSPNSREEVRQQLALTEQDRMVLVTVGGGGDGVQILDAYIASLSCHPKLHKAKTVLTLGPEMPEPEKRRIRRATTEFPNVRVKEFSNDLMGYMDAADVVVSMGGYGTVCELLTLRKPAVVVPRLHPLQEQWIRCARMASLGLFSVIHPNELTSTALGNLVGTRLENPRSNPDVFSQIDLRGLERVAKHLSALLEESESDRIQGRSPLSVSPLHIESAEAERSDSAVSSLRIFNLKAVLPTIPYGFLSELSHA